MPFHGNSKRKNTRPHHLYAIMDKTTDDVFKYGISDKPIGKDGFSSRIREQVSYLNLVAGEFRFFAKILIFNIQGKEKAAEIETEHIDAFRETHGRNPRGNRRRKS